MSELPEDGTTICAVGEREGNVILNFPKSIKWAAFDPETARQIGEAMAKEAYSIHTGKKYDDNRSIISDNKRNMITKQVEFMINNFALKKKKADFASEAIVDFILGEIE